MARPALTRHSIEPVPFDDADAYSIEEFCRRHRFSVPQYYKLRQERLTPAEFRVGTRVLISKEAAARWRAEREAALAAAEAETSAT
jgi:hypothetical protein